ncbi:MAG: hypothetical protein COX81_01515 [Candidatus Magasanikbacteria bacterium CG_4_10_14_0_2_um_filter_37_12]|uniref:GIY-YIG domain-containing protein n=1 Tax=Candidatus Magasanikbacteria bacterium CG_4_10_14_0_2_um_filter_37_12 TaxID=1974637 RepID=A0A2M7V8U0_9BACT|nr:MAG: hypothetical protein COX81_01515 [Candidatus Magasanikbacteria bacterium CG_4_10_14_0_2_um_filter_37_12]
MYTLYILQCSDGSLYTGITRNLDNRLKTHSEGKGSKYVRARLPITLVFKEKHIDRSEATKREMEIKKMSRENKLKIIKKI